MERRGRARRLAALLVFLPAAVCSAAAPRAVEGPVADAIHRGIGTGRGTFDPAGWDAVLRAHVDAGGSVDYAGLQKDRAGLDAFLADVGRADLASLPRPELLALFVNAYNACTVRLILDGARDGRLPVSIRDLPDPWGRKVCTVGGHLLSLDTLEHGILRPTFRDVAIHAAVNCASKSCPPLAPWAFRGERVGEQLRERLDAWLGSDAHVRVEGGRLRVSKILDWYGDDFVDPSFQGSAGSVAEVVRRHAKPEARRALDALGPSPRMEFLDYDWSLNGR